MGRKSDGAVFAALEAREAELATLHAAAVDALDARHAGAVADAAAAHARLAAAAAAEHRDTVARQHAFQEEAREAALQLKALLEPRGVRVSAHASTGDNTSSNDCAA